MKALVERKLDQLIAGTPESNQQGLDKWVDFREIELIDFPLNFPPRILIIWHYYNFIIVYI